MRIDESMMLPIGSSLSDERHTPRKTSKTSPSVTIGVLVIAGGGELEPEGVDEATPCVNKVDDGMTRDGFPGCYAVTIENELLQVSVLPERSGTGG